MFLIITCTHTYYLQASQRIMDQFRGPLGSAAIAILLAFFASSRDLRHSDEARVEWCKKMLEDWRFIYGQANGDAQKVCGTAQRCVIANGPLCFRDGSGRFSRA